MDAIINALQDTPIPNILVVAGIGFLLLAMARQIAGKIEISPERQRWAGLVGILLLISGVALHILPSRSSSPAATATIQVTPAPAVATSVPPATRGAGAALPTSVPPAPGSATEDCFAQYFSAIPAARVKTIEMGTADFEVLAPDQPKDGVIGMKFTELQQAIGGMRFFFISGSAVFKVDTVVDARCQAIESYANVTSGDNKRVLQNWDHLQIRFGDQAYLVQLGYGGGTVRAGTQHVSP
jgi:hypothetical protein